MCPVVVALLVLAPVGAVAQDVPAFVLPELAEPEPEPDPFEAFFEQSRLTGDWGGLRTDLEEIGIRFDLFYNHYYGVNARGGQDTSNAQRHSGSFDMFLRVDTESLGLVPGGQMLFHTISRFGRNVNDKVGALTDVFDDAKGDRTVLVAQWWYQQKLLEDKLQLRLGYLTTRVIMDRNAYANNEDRQFMNSFLNNNRVIGPARVGLGGVVFFDPVEWLGFTVAAVDGQAKQFGHGFDTTFHGQRDFFAWLQTDIRVKLKGPNGDLPGTYRIGVIYDPRRKERFRPPNLERWPVRPQRGDYGLYLSFDQLVYRERPDSLQGLGLFFRYGVRRSDINRLDDFWSAGFQYQGLLPERDEDVFGFGMYTTSASDRYRRWVNRDFKRETGFEMYYNIQVTPWMWITPDFQVVSDSGGLRSRDNAIVFGVRTRISF